MEENTRDREMRKNVVMGEGKLKKFESLRGLTGQNF